MSSSGDEANPPSPKPSSSLQQKRKKQRACDACRRKKIRCDGRTEPGKKCTHCIEADKDCTYVETVRRPPPIGYVEDLERRYAKAQMLLSRLGQSEELDEEIDAVCVQPSTSPTSANKITQRLADSLAHPTEDTDDGEDSDDTLLLSDRFNKLHISNGRLFGKSSGAALVQTALDIQGENPRTFGNSRPFAWITKAWEQFPTPHRGPAGYQFPEHDLILILMDVYFDHIHLITPLFHRPTVERSVASKAYLVNDEAGVITLAICAVAARLCDDPRAQSENGRQQGWKWMTQLTVIRKTLLAAASLNDLQLYALSCQFLAGIGAPQAAWNMVGMGLRVAQDAGAHRSYMYSPPITAEKELWRRAWWVLMYMDRSLSSSLGRACAIQDEDFDLGLPIDCDDEYWAHPNPELAWKQPPGKPSKISFFIYTLKLNHILATALRTIYSINKSKMVLGFVGPQWEQHIVAELDSALNRWIDTIPDHLRWNPNCEDINFFRQSVTLYANYYLVQIIIHRPFISSLRRDSPLSFPSLVICANAARSCSHILDPRDPRCPDAMINLQMPVFTAAVVLILTILGGKKQGLKNDFAKEMKDVHRCTEMLMLCTKRDIIYELASVGNLPLEPDGPCSDNGCRMQAHGGETVTEIPPLRENQSEHPRFSVPSHSSQYHQPHTRTESNDQMHHHPRLPPLYLTDRPLPGQRSDPSHSFQIPGVDMDSMLEFPSGSGNISNIRRHLSSNNDPTDMGSMSTDSSFFSQSYDDRSQQHAPPTGSAPSWYANGQAYPGWRQTMDDQDMMRMWSNAPPGFSFDDWAAYLSSARNSENAHGQGF